MIDTEKWPAVQATPSATLEQEIMDPRVPKSEREWCTLDGPLIPCADYEREPGADDDF